MELFSSKGSAGLLMDSESGEIISLVSLPDFDINKRQKISDISYNNKITNSVFELGSIFKTFTVALAIETKIYSPDSIIKDIPKKLSVHVMKYLTLKNFQKI